MTIFTGDKLLESVKRGITIPFNQTRFTDDDLLAFADEELETTIMPIILGMREEYAVYEEDVALVAGVSKYQIPSRAAGRILRDLELQIDSQTSVSLAYIAPDDRNYYTNSSNYGSNPTGFYFENDKVVLIPSPISSPNQSLKMRFLMRHSQITKVSNARAITNINTTTNELTLASPFANTVQAATLVDLIKSTSQPVIRDYDLALTNVSGNIVTLPSLPSDLAVGDYVAIAGQTPVLCLPEETHQVLAQAVAVRVMEAQGDAQAMQIAQANLDRKVKAMQLIMMPRIEGETQVVMQRNGLLRNGLTRNIMRNLRV
jgi:hypothetical protein